MTKVGRTDWLSVFSDLLILEKFFHWEVLTILFVIKS